MNAPIPLTAVLALAVSAACSSQVSYVGGAGGAAASSATGPTTTSATSATTTSGTTGAGGAMCGGKAGIPCAATEYCDFPNDTCGIGDQAGICKPRPNGCPENYLPTCGCDGKVHSNACDSNAAGADVSAKGGCPAPMGYFPCGSGFCSNGFQYCERQTSDVATEPDGYRCVQVPAACGKTPTCACVAMEPCGAFCKSLGVGQLMLTCPGG